MNVRFVRFATFLLISLALLGLSWDSSAQGENVFVTAIHSDLKGANNFISSNSGANNTVWNFYVWGGTHPGLYGGTTLGNKPVPSLAAEPVSDFTEEDGLFTSTVKLLQGVQWADGSEITAEDVAFTFNSFVQVIESTGNPLSLELGGGYPSLYDADFSDHVEAVDKYTAKFFMKQIPGLARWEFGILQAWIFQKAFWEDKFAQAMASDDPVLTLTAFDTTDEPTAGAFNFKRWEPGAFAEVTKNDNYFFSGTVSREYEGGGFEEVLPDGTARSSGDTSTALLIETTEGPFVDAVVYNLFGSQAAAALAVVNGDADYHFNPLGYGKATLDQLEAADGVRVLKNSANGVFYLSFNMRKSPFNYREFRQAVRCVIDKEFVANQLLSGLVIPAYSPVPVGNQLFHNPLNDANAEAACVGLSEAERLAQARSLLESAGFQFDGDRLVADPEGNPLKQLELLHPNAAYDNNRNIFGLHIVDRLNKLGVPVRDVPAGFNNIVTLVFDEQDFDMWQLGWGLGFFPDYLFDFYESSNTIPGGNAAQGGVCSARENEATGCQETYDELAAAFLAERDLDKAVQIARDLQQLVFDNVAYVPTHYVIQFDAYRADRVNWQGLEDQPILDGLQNGAAFRSIVQKAQ